MEMGKEIRRQRNERGLTQEALAAALNVTAHLLPTNAETSMDATPGTRQAKAYTRNTSGA